VILDLAGVSYLSSAGVRSLLVALKKTKLAGGQLSLSRVAGSIEQVLQLSGLRSLFPISATAK
jgi:anti-anti-sigma factor